MTIWIVVEVKRGFIQEPIICFNKTKAMIAKMNILNEFNRDYDEVEMFKKQLH